MNRKNNAITKGNNKKVSNLVFYAQSTFAVI